MRQDSLDRLLEFPSVRRKSLFHLTGGGEDREAVASPHGREELRGGLSRKHSVLKREMEIVEE
jgi:hypothetical protein